MSDREQEYWVAYMMVKDGDYPLSLRKVKAESRKEAAETYVAGKSLYHKYIMVLESPTLWTVTTKREAHRT